MSKLIASIGDAIKASGLKDGMTVSFHHHLRNGDFVLNAVMAEIAAGGIRDITINASSIFDCHAPLIDHIKNGVVSGLECAYMGERVGRAISEGALAKPVIFRSHGGRPADIESGKSRIDVAFIAAPSADRMGNCTGKEGPSACGSLGYAFADAQYAAKVVVITDNLVPYPLTNFSISETCVDFVVPAEKNRQPRRHCVRHDTHHSRSGRPFNGGLRSANHPALRSSERRLFVPDRRRRRFPCGRQMP